MIYDILKTIPLFQGLDHEDLEKLSNSIEIVNIKKGDILFNEGDEGDKAYIIFKGELEVIKESLGREVLLAIQGEGVLIGEMALLESLPRNATLRARADSVLYAIKREELDHLMNSSPSAMKSLFQTVIRRLKEKQIHLAQSEKMAQLGTLTAGVAHELNNPAAAVNRGADQLREATRELDASYAHISRLGFNDKQWEILDSLAQKILVISSSPPEMDALTRSDMEMEIEDWLTDHTIEEPWKVAPNLVNLQFNEEDLESLTTEFPKEHFLCVIEWLDATYSVYSLLNELSKGAAQISTIVKSLKSYSFLDQAPIQSVNINEGLDDTLTLLNSKLKGGISIKRDYSEDLPEIVGYGSELNQVWTNLLDNASDALAEQEGAQIIIRTRQKGGWVFVEVEDNGPGIPEENQNKIFDAFFTTKGPGKGTGLGLNISYNIIVQKHRGDMKVNSGPGRTCFEISLPIENKD